MAKKKQKAIPSGPVTIGAHRGYSAESAVIIAKELQRIEKEHGRVTPHQVLDESKRPNSPLHQFFDWDDETAADNWRLFQARYLIRSIYIEKQVAGSNEPVRITLYHNANDEDGRAYFSLSKIAEDVNLFVSAAYNLGNQVQSLQKSLDSLNLIAPKTKKEVVKKLAKTAGTMGKLSKELKK